MNLNTDKTDLDELTFKNFCIEFENYLTNWSRIAIFYHVRLDGDAYGSAFALKQLIEKNYVGKAVVVVCLDYVDDVNELPETELIKYNNAIANNKRANKNALKKARRIAKENNEPEVAHPILLPETKEAILASRLKELLATSDAVLPNIYKISNYYNSLKNGNVNLPNASADASYVSTDFSYANADASYVSTDFSYCAFTNKPFLAVTVDVNSKSRICGKYYLEKAFKNGWPVISIDHHTAALEPIEATKTYIEQCTSACEIVLKIAKTLNWKVDEVVAKCLYTGIITDTNRFFYEKVGFQTLQLCAWLLKETNYNPYETNLLLAERSKSLIAFQNWVIKNKKEIKIKINRKQKDEISNLNLNPASAPVFFASEPKTSSNYALWYAIIDKNTYTLFNPNIVHNPVYLFANIKNVPVWFAVIYDPIDNNYKISMRSKSIPVVTVAKMFNGGGHNLACSCSIKDLSELDSFINVLKAFVKEKLVEENDLTLEENKSNSKNML